MYMYKRRQIISIKIGIHLSNHIESTTFISISMTIVFILLALLSSDVAMTSLDTKFDNYLERLLVFFSIFKCVLF
jgi:hypothetical protein